MKTALAALAAAAVASACCVGPVLFVSLGSGALAAASTRLDALRPVSLMLTVTLMGLAFHHVYRGNSAACAEGACPPAANRSARVVLWISAIIVVLLAAFPYYSAFLF